MAKVKIVTDSNSGITQSEAEKLGISVLPMPFLIDGEQYFEDVNLTQTEFYEHLKDDAAVSTSQPAIGDVSDLWDALLSDGSEIVHIPMSSGLSESCHTAEQLAKSYNGRVRVVNNQRISVTQKQSVLDAIKLAERGKSAAEIGEYLEKTKYDSSIYISLETLKYLKKGGRLTPAAALIGTILKIKPVLQIQGEKLDAFQKVHTLKKAKEVMIAALRNDLSTRFAEYANNGEMSIAVAHSANEAEAQIFAKELKDAFPEIPVTFVDPLSLSVSCHIGPGSLACTCARVLK
ncbi:MAG: DegV family protein [Candidatus Gallimonas sp.]